MGVNWEDRRARRAARGGGGGSSSTGGGGGRGGHDAQEEASSDGGDKTKTAAKQEVNSTVDSVLTRIRAAADALGLTGECVPFGSHVNGFSTAASDCDLSYMPLEGNSQETPVRVLQRFANELPKHGFTDITTIFQAFIPLVKAVDTSGADVDLCVGNQLGQQNSKLIAAYCALDPRVSQVGKLVKQWAKAWELVGSSDGHLNSYAYTLLTIYYLMQTTPPVVPNLQGLASGNDPDVMIRDKRWGREIAWNCKFWEDVDLIPKSTNKDSVASLLRGFFEYYTQTFDWYNHAVSIRLAFTGTISKHTLHSAVTEDQWYVEDPFDLRHNLSSQCTKEGRQRILLKMRETLRSISTNQPTDKAILALFAKHCTKPTQKNPSTFLLKCRINPEKVTAPDLVEALRGGRDVGHFTVRFPLGRTREVYDAFAVFKAESDRRQVHKMNETYVGEWQLRLLPCSSWALEDALKAGEYEEIEVAPREAATDEKAKPDEEGGADHAGGEQAAEQVRSGLRAASHESEVNVLIQRAQALGLTHEADLGRHKLRSLREKGPGRRSPASTEELPQAAEGEEPPPAEKVGRGSQPRQEKKRVNEAPKEKIVFQ